MVRKYLLGSAFGAVALALLTPVASAGTVRMSSSALTYVAATGETNDVTITRTSNGFTVTDAGGAPTVDPASFSTCAPTAAGTVACVVAPGARPKVWTSLLDGDDRATFSGDSVFEAEGGPGADTLAGGAGQNTLRGDDGDDTLTGGPLADRIETGVGDDHVSGGGGDDHVLLEIGASVVSGGAGSDTVSFSTLDVPVTASLDGLANDGVTGEDHLHADVENLRGGGGDDTLIGNDGPNRLEGSHGEDRIEAGAGDDFIDGGEDADTILAGPGDDQLESFPLTGATDVLDPGTGNDFGRYTPPMAVTYASRSTGITATVQGQYASAQVVSGAENDVFWFVSSITGGSGNDVLTSSAPIRFDGGAGDDRMTGSAGADTLIGGLGRDLFDAGAGADRVEAAGDRARDTGTCGDGTDTASADQQDALTVCETG